MTIPELRAMLEVLTEEDFRAVMPLERCNSSYLRLVEERAKLKEALEGLIVQLRAHNVPHIQGLLEWADNILKKCK